MELRYRHKIPRSEGYTFVIDNTRIGSTKQYGGNTARELYDELLIAEDTDELVTLNYRRNDDTTGDIKPKFVDVTAHQILEGTGTDYTSKIQVTTQEL